MAKSVSFVAVSVRKHYPSPWYDWSKLFRNKRLEKACLLLDTQEVAGPNPAECASQVADCREGTSVFITILPNIHLMQKTRKTV